MEGFYYLHRNGDLIFKSTIVARSIYDECFDSPFVKRVWHVDTEDRLCAWKVVLEALWLKCSMSRAKELADKWGLTFQDSIELLRRTPWNQVTSDMKAGMTIFITEILGMGVDEYWEKVKEEWK